MYKTVIKSLRPIKSIRVISRATAAGTVRQITPQESLETFIRNNDNLKAQWAEFMSQQEMKRKEAHADGVTEGRVQGVEEGKREVLQAAESLRNAVGQLTSETDKFFFEAESFMVKLALRVAEKILRKELQDDKELAMKLVKHTLRWVKSGEKVVVHVNPVDFDALNFNKESESDPDVTLRFVSDEKVESGGCVLQTEWGVIDAQISTQLGEIYNKLMDAEDSGVG